MRTLYQTYNLSIIRCADSLQVARNIRHGSYAAVEVKRLRSFRDASTADESGATE